MNTELIIQMRELAATAMDSLHLASYYDGNDYPEMKEEQMQIAKKSIQALNVIMFPVGDIDFIQSEIAAENNVNRWLQEKFNAAGKGMD